MAKLQKRTQLGKQRTWEGYSRPAVHSCIPVRWNYTIRTCSAKSQVWSEPETQKTDLGQKSQHWETLAPMSCLSAPLNQNIWLILLTEISAVNLSPLLKWRSCRFQFCVLCLILHTFLNKRAIYNFDKFSACKYIQKGASEKIHNSS